MLLFKGFIISIIILLFLSSVFGHDIDDDDDDDDDRPRNKCGLYSVAVVRQYFPETCSTKFCYTVSSTLKATILKSFNILCAIPNSSMLRADNSSETWSACSGISTKFNMIFPGSYTKCFWLDGLSNSVPGAILLNTLRNSCAFEIYVPSLPIICPPVNCVVEARPAFITCNNCTAVCGRNDRSVVVDNICTYPIVTPASYGGRECITESTVSCTTTCTARCKYQLEPPKRCTADCINTYVTMTTSYTLVTPAEFSGPSCCIPSAIKSICTKNCKQPCVLDDNINNAQCPKCPARCDGLRPFPTATITCQLATLVNAEPGGDPCLSAQKEFACTNTCVVNCLQALDAPTQVCSPNCVNPTKTVTRFYKTIAYPANGGAPCNPTLSWVKSICSMDADAAFNMCNADCVVDGIPTDPCSQSCNAGASSGFIGTATYPITIKTPSFGGFPCPTITKDCNCNDCALNPTPTSTGKCDAICTRFDDSYARGVRTLYFSVKSLAVGDGKCTTTRLQECYRKCPCEVTSLNTGSCTYLTTLTNVTPNPIYGIQDYTVYGSYPQCIKTGLKPCSQVMSPQQCIAVASCPTCRCTPTVGPNYILSSQLQCSWITIQTKQFGGAACPTYSPSSTCALTCPGCAYLPSVCGCQFLGSSTLQNSYTVFTGFTTCSYPLLLSNQQQIPGETNYSPSLLCPTSISTFSQQCSSTLFPGQCIFSTHSCGPCTVTLKGANAFSQYYLGTQSCTVSDIRGTVAPDICATPTVTVNDCTLPVVATNCRYASYCQPCSAQCSAGATNVVTATAQCSASLIQTENNGGIPCPAITSTVTTCTIDCNQNADKALGLENSLLGGFVNAVFKSDSSLFGGSAQGRLYFCKNAVIQGYTIGSNLQNYVKTCSNDWPALFAGENLIMGGNVLGSEVLVGGNCTSGISSQCGLRSGLNSNSCSEKLIDCDTYFSNIEQLSQYLGGLTQTLSPLKDSQGFLTINFTNSDLEVIEIDPSICFPVPPLNFYSGNLKPNATIVFNLRGAVVSMSYFSLSFLELYSEQIIWNFPNAKTIRFDGIEIFGHVIAPLASVTGMGKIHGRLIADNVSPSTNGNSLSFNYLPYSGQPFNF